MKFVKEEFENTYEEKKSKFIAHMMPYDKFDEVMKRLKEEHPKGRHFVYAYRYLNEYGQVVENSSDDGEPKGTSGKPCLAVLAGAGIINSAVIIVRYFGGIKLGTGGLVRAYGSSVNEVINKAEFFEYKELITKKLYCQYAELSKLEYLLNSMEIVIKDKEFTDSIVLSISLSKEEYNNLVTQLPRTIKYE
ncbi:YigZ family protein [Arcobacter roscoffensis]|uniref:YigZ family protein n=1 Tax=Arcobacter roscoffensis TaxID=2961520 RepID=A0ABY5E3M5_9BACT|nr:YigZ family protein [Arcobacter roscoffensis]UTJ05770.1 YigZ family protein [Arcobacter roscoffensis]